MDSVIRGRRITDQDIGMIRSLLVTHGHLGRSFISRELCKRWQWLQPNGAPKDAACRALLLRLETEGLILLAPRRGGSTRPRRHVKCQLDLPFTDPASEPAVSFPAAIEWRLANSGSEFFLYKDLIQSRHYLGYCRAIGQRMRYIAYGNGKVIACFGWAAAAWKVAGRDRFIGWNPSQRQKNLHLIVNNTRFLILSRIPHLASHLLASNLRRLSSDWEALYGCRPVLAETFVDSARFKGTCYKAANWTCVGLTQGRGKWDRHTQRSEPIKSVYVYPLDKKFRQILTHD